MVVIEQAKTKKHQAQHKQLKDETIIKMMQTWSTQIIPNFEAQRTKSTTMNMIYEWGIPPKLRESLWEMAIGNHLRLTRQLYQSFKKKRASDVEASIEKDLIKVDLARTFPALQFFREGGPLYQPFKEVLECYARFRPDVGYVQGMSYVVATLLLNVPSPENTFMCLANMINSSHLLPFYLMDTDEIDFVVRTIDNLLKECLPALHKHFHEHNIVLSVFILDWFMTLFSKSFPLDIVVRIWDLYFMEGEVTLYKTTIGIFKYFHDKLILLDFEGLTYFISHLSSFVSPANQLDNYAKAENNSVLGGELMLHLSEEIDDQVFFDSIKSVNVTHTKLQKAKQQATLPPAATSK